ncbi:type I-E CRISPR-associated protein Cas6/Cse3/CasE [Komagataeibacter sp. AV436]|uniref:Type I-E CRISPR-associated protein Cas6/Cse3/CasE n=1 Tax=Komagataeibacter melomenusus TaxID=2766578 RepID=A0ABX2ACF0_9PROT|nr:type I-E CRISPR-associated protein Cas6/Cse3/CasE [Komagataeibacter melomenusus]MBV1830003.1 type I-E CRISPR-associated protein Cas6/Cse3/CasE [Komagataeibacter melomenusus]NPC65938.1 type I-E CRISPR-associated protein Cas6/Cse3/CasE [Komagataeibacter melomenusus]
MSGAFLSRVSLRRDASVQALARLLVPQGEGRQHGAAHHLLWVLFGDTPTRQRDFLWRQTEAGRFMVLSARQPVDAHGLFALESRPFAPVLKEGDRLRFLLRANATVDRKTPGRVRSKRHDVVMDALHAIPHGQRAQGRDNIVPKAFAAWLGRQGARTGFAPQADGLVVEGCDVLRIPRGPGQREASFGVVDAAGELSVTDPALFVPALMQGFGRARAFGCGLMLIRRAPGGV